ncbi:3',5'-cyclic adenosine monophosphate phosphodiesterase CpdA [Candidatus Lokiarchaeum ossiferum]|uniref:3',5'-cyclic adenosine monophosphate phosphodiesterase CpdA n=1 Tax=Candidatus Lokiarchaeum ossiferum TaxID=2951803 RepID=A0ABY6HMW5_9ARCH|nr:3',5'-cyclic adenosine monophosphate phosphodiesterase CpdA [Candidatus Lokiarchaeum sp. B-35]
MENVVLCLSDIHFTSYKSKDPNDANFSKRMICLDKLIDQIKTLPDESKPDICVIVGDIAYYGSNDDYLHFKKDWLDKFLSELSIPMENLLITPGNHDRLRSKSHIIDYIDDKDEVENELETNLDHYFSGFEDYISFMSKDLKIPEFEYGDKHGKYHKNYLFGFRKIGQIYFISLNSCWFSKNSSTDKKKLWLGDLFFSVLQNKNRIDREELPFVVTLFHHPKRWFADNRKKDNDFDRIRRKTHVLITGHEHETRDNENIIIYPDSETLHLKLGSTFSKKNYPNKCCLLKFMRGRSVEYSLIAWDNNQEEWVYNHKFRRWSVPTDDIIKRIEIMGLDISTLKNNLKDGARINE